MKITKDVRALAERFGNRWDVPAGTIGKFLWEMVDCMNMIESHLAYNDYSFMENHYKDRYVSELGYENVKEIWEMMKKYFDENCYVKRGVYTDCEGLTYNSLIDRNEQ